jgi:hypothetical protein
MSIKYIRQYDEKDCGPACLAMKLVPNLSVLAYSRKRGIDTRLP